MPETPLHLRLVDQQWECQRELRQRCASGSQLMLNSKGANMGPVMGTIANVGFNFNVLAAITGRMAQHGVVKAAPLEAYTNAVFDFYVAASFPRMELAPVAGAPGCLGHQALLDVP